MEPKAKTPSQIKHLEMLQAVVTRMANNSFLIKGWCITLVSALLALSAKDAKSMVFVAYLPVVMFWWLDAFFLRQERLFRERFDQVREDDSAEADFSMKTLGDKSKVDPQRKVAWSVTMRWFYGWLFVAVTLALLVLRGYFGALKHWLMA
ncbi:MAG: hypothetical protein M3X11_05120 [Acidobacteriota bacterium]|nr:hypothetical protein [Acidobacteriota bacterium]